jgi:hypothetical protein
MGPAEKSPHLRGVKKYDVKTRDKVRRRIKQMRRMGTASEVIADTLAKEGVLTPNGKTPDRSFVTNQISHIFKTRNSGTPRKYTRRVPIAPPPPTKAKGLGLPPSIELMMADDALSPAMKFRLIAAYQAGLHE